MEVGNIRNFSIIAHIDHGKSTLADRILEFTGSIEKRKMRDQILDQMELERERGITIKMQPVRIKYKDYILNLIDTPGHIDFSYEVSRALQAVEGAILLVDATQGVQAQTIANVEVAKSLGLKIIPVLNKIDLATARIEETKEEIRRLLGDSYNEILEVSGKTGAGVEELLEKIIKEIPAPKFEHKDNQRALIFDFEYSNHQGVIVFIRVIDGKIKSGDRLLLSQTQEKFIAGEIGIFAPQKMVVNELSAGEIGYIVTSIKKPSIASVGDSVVSIQNPLSPLPGYMQPKPVVWASVYPESQDDFVALKQALERLRLSDSSLDFEEESSGSLGRGFRCGFLGMLHLEIITERLRREFNLSLIIASPTITYKILLNNGQEKFIYSPMHFPDDGQIKKIFEPWVNMQIITQPTIIGSIIQILHDHEAELGETEQFGDYRTILNVKMPLRELMRGFFDKLKSVSAGYASLNYKVEGMREVNSKDIVRLDILIADDLIPAFSKIISNSRVQREAEDTVEKLKEVLPRQLFAVKIQAKAFGRIIASRTVSAMRKDVTGYLYGGDITRKMKLLEKQKRGKKRMKETGKVNIPHDVFVKMMQN